MMDVQEPQAYSQKLEKMCWTNNLPIYFLIFDFQDPLALQVVHYVFKYVQWFPSPSLKRLVSATWTVMGYKYTESVTVHQTKEMPNEN